MSRPRAHAQPASGTYVPAVTCSCGKRGYEDRRAAKLVIREMRRRGLLRTDRVNAYRCDSGSELWHVGHQRADTIGPDLNDPRGGEEWKP